MNTIILKIITLLHVLFILFVVGVPFTSSTYFLLIHSVFVPFMVLHWICNDNTCVLTVIEKYMRKKMYGDDKKENCFTCRLIEPVYDFNKNYASFSKGIYAATILLWLTSVSKLYFKYKGGEITGIRDLFVI